jgi:hypothetical protein
MINISDMKTLDISKVHQKEERKISKGHIQIVDDKNK